MAKWYILQFYLYKRTIEIMACMTEPYLFISDYLFKLIYNEFPHFYPFSIEQKIYISFNIFIPISYITEADLFVNYSLIELQF